MHSRSHAASCSAHGLSRSTTSRSCSIKFECLHRRSRTASCSVSGLPLPAHAASNLCLAPQVTHHQLQHVRPPTLDNLMQHFQLCAFHLCACTPQFTHRQLQRLRPGKGNKDEGNNGSSPSSSGSKGGSAAASPTLQVLAAPSLQQRLSLGGRPSVLKHAGDTHHGAWDESRNHGPGRVSGSGARPRLFEHNSSGVGAPSGQGSASLSPSHRKSMCADSPRRSMHVDRSKS